MICPDCGDRGAVSLYRIRYEGGLTPLGYETVEDALPDAVMVAGDVLPAVWCPVEQRWVA